MSSDLRQRVSDELLPFVRQPGQYVGGEVNQAATDWPAAEVRIALAFPDTYAIGISHLGSLILYDIANRIDGVACERVYAPWPDAERVMRERAIGLFTWESRAAVASADLLAVSLQYEMTFTNVLNLLDLAGVPVGRARRDLDEPVGQGAPLVIAGGPVADNPEPMADFIDLFVIGDGEHAIRAIVAECKAAKRAGASKRELLRALARKYPWAYAPAFYRADYRADGTLAAFEPVEPGAPATIRRCRTEDFETIDAPLAPLVPWTQAVHERVTVEIMRGCPQRCRFCHAGYTKRPLRWRSVGRVVELCEAAWRATGYSEIALTSLSTGDYPRLGELIDRLNATFAPRRVSLSVPSMRVDKQLKHLPWQIKGVRKGGLTIAAEAARDALRRVIGKKVTDGDLLDGVRAAYAAGWRAIKLYFMIGLPGETEADVAGIVELANRVAQARRELGTDPDTGRRAGPASVTAAVSPLVPKPHTPLQWVGQRDAAYFHQARERLRDLARGTPVRVRVHEVERAIVEAALARGDRRVGAAVEAAWRAGARMDGWDEQFDAGRWHRAFAAAGLDVAFYAQRERSADERLPWGHIESGASAAELTREAARTAEQLEAVALGP